MVQITNDGKCSLTVFCHYFRRWGSLQCAVIDAISMLKRLPSREALLLLPGTCVQHAEAGLLVFDPAVGVVKIGLVWVRL